MPSTIFVWTPFPYAYFALYFAGILTPTIIRPSPRWRWLFFLPLLLLTWRLLHDGQAGYLSSTLWFALLPVASDYILLTDVQRELYRLEDPTGHRPRGRGGSGRSSPAPSGGSIPSTGIERAPLIDRIKWALDLFFSARGVGWAHAPRHLRTGRRIPRAKFLLQQLLRLVAALLLFDLANLHARWNPAFCARLGMARAGWVWRLVSTAMWAVGGACGMLTVHIPASIVFVGLGLSRPQDWPPLFGGLGDVTSVRTFWSRGWHQLFRRPLSTHGKFISAILRLPPRSHLSTCVQIFTAFLLSGLVHSLGEYVPLQRVGVPSGSLIFFGIQPAAIALETLLSALSQKSGLAGTLTPAVRRICGIAWVFSWFVLTLPIMQDPLLRTGEMGSRADFSLIMRLWPGRHGGRWALPPAGFCMAS